ncbi:MAG: hypothetical protein M1827_000640 [Pycnora praestabilis]|nr:MAG: hypothetical protein M1827_000640 [Pycnora praestabilis]
MRNTVDKPSAAQDLRNHGDSPAHPKHDYISMADDVEGFIGEHGLVNPTLIGHSMCALLASITPSLNNQTRGAKTAMTVALRSPDLLGNLVSVDNAPIDATLNSDFGKYIQGMKKVENANVKKQSEADDILRGCEDSLVIRQFLLTNLIRSSGSNTFKFRIPIQILAAALDNMGDFPFRDPDDARFEKPALFVRGTKSHYVADEALPLIGRFFPRFELRDIESGHWVISENPEAFRKGMFDHP